MKRTTGWLVLLNLLLALALAALWFTPDGRLRNVRWPVPEARRPDFAGMAPTLPESAPADPARFPATLERPLFSPSRRPAPPPPPPPAPAPPPPPAPVVEKPAPDPLDGVKILGLYVGKDSGGIIAMVDGKARRAALGDKIGDWTISAIEGREVTFARGDKTRALPLEARRPKPGEAAATPPAAAPPAAATAAPIAQRQQAQQLELQRRRALEGTRAGLVMTPAPPPPPQ